MKWANMFAKTIKIPNTWLESNERSFYDAKLYMEVCA